jgi:hypothetical protein
MHGLFTFNVAAQGILKLIRGGSPANMELGEGFAALVKPEHKLVN